MAIEANPGLSPQTERSDGFDARQAINSPGFLEFIAKFPNGDEIVRDDTELASAFKLFERKKVLASEVKTLLRQQIAKDLEVSVTEADLSAVEIYLEKCMASGETWAINRLERALEQYHELPTQLENKRKTIAELGDKNLLLQDQQKLIQEQHDRDQKREELLKQAEQSRVIGKLWKRRQANKLHRENKIQDAQISEIRKKIWNIDSAENSKMAAEQEFAQIKNHIFHEIEGVESIFKAAEKKANEKLNSYFYPAASSADFAKGLTYFEKISGAGKEEVADPKYWENGIEDETGQKQNPEALRQRITEKLVNQTAQEINNFLQHNAAHNILSGYDKIRAHLSSSLGGKFNQEKFREIQFAALRAAKSRANDPGKRLALVRLEWELTMGTLNQ